VFVNSRSELEETFAGQMDRIVWTIYSSFLRLRDSYPCTSLVKDQKLDDIKTFPALVLYQISGYVLARNLPSLLADNYLSLESLRPQDQFIVTRSFDRLQVLFGNIPISEWQKVLDRDRAVVRLGQEVSLLRETHVIPDEEFKSVLHLLGKTKHQGSFYAFITSLAASYDAAKKEKKVKWKHHVRCDRLLQVLTATFDLKPITTYGRSQDLRALWQQVYGSGRTG